MRVLVTDAIAEAGLKILWDAGLEVENRSKLSEGDVAAIIGDYDALLVRSETKVTRRIIESAVNLKIIGRAGVGVDNIDVEAATERGIIVVNAPEGNTIAATEHTMALMLALARNVPQASNLLKQGRWEKKKFTGVELRDKVLGVIGLGKIGAAVAKRARGLEMHVLSYDPYVSGERAKNLGVELGGFEQVLERSDFITVHLPLSKDTYHLIGRDELARCKPGVRILNVARGGIIDEEALYEALRSGQVGGAAIDVFEQEPITDSPLFGLDSVIVTPHLGASTEEAQLNVAKEVAEEVVRLNRGEPIRNAVNIASIKPELRSLLEPYLPLAERLGSFAAQLVKCPVELVRVQYNGEIASYDLTPLTNALLKGLLQPALQDAVNYVNAPVVARQRGIRVHEAKAVEMQDYSNLITVQVEGGNCGKSLAGALFGANEPRVVAIDGYTVDAVPSGHMLVIPHLDRPRIIGPVASLIGAYDVNIAGMQVGRKEIGGRAVMVLNIDGAVSAETLRDIDQVEGVLDVYYVCL